ncbi:hypothetical protein MTO96_030918 [Rhipicephalus appendiculatus]
MLGHLAIRRPNRGTVDDFVQRIHDGNRKSLAVSCENGLPDLRHGEVFVQLRTGRAELVGKVDLLVSVLYGQAASRNGRIACAPMPKLRTVCRSVNRSLRGLGVATPRRLAIGDQRPRRATVRHARP